MADVSSNLGSNGYTILVPVRHALTGAWMGPDQAGPGRRRSTREEGRMTDASTAKPIAVFFELEGWEEPYVRSQLPDVDVHGTHDRLEPDHLGPRTDAEIVSTFITSRVTADV